VVTVGYEYEAGWRWQITVDPTDPATLRLRMDNVIPQDAVREGVVAGPHPAMVTELRARPPRRAGPVGRTGPALLLTWLSRQ
jgi:hypothetical protein